MNCTGFWFYILSYLIMLPRYQDCTYTDPQPEDPVSACTAENICLVPSPIIDYSIDWDNIYSIHNWVEKLDLTCTPGWKVGLLGSMVFVGWVITLIWVPRLSDKYGRKTIYMIGMWGDCACFIAMFLVTSIDLMICVTFVFGLCTTIRVNIGFVYIMEMMPKRNQTFYASAYNCQEGSILFMGTLYFWFVSKDWIYFSLIGFTM